MRYTRFVPLHAVNEGLAGTIEHVRAHLSEVSTADDNPDALADRVEISFEYVDKHRKADRGILVIGELDVPRPVAAYLAVPVDDGKYAWDSDTANWEGEGGR